MLLSVVILTYNQDKYLNKALESIFSQKTDFEFEILVCDDCSTDSTSTIIHDFQTKFQNSNLLKYYRHNNNIGIKNNGIFALDKCLGKYVAICEGDDYWIDEYKLSKQVNFLENNLNVSVCFHDFLILRDGHFLNSKVDLHNQKPVTIPNFFFKSYSDTPYWVTQTLTAVFRRSLIELETYNRYIFFRDYHLYYHLLKKGKGYYFSDIMGVYRDNSKGEFTKLSIENKLKIDAEIKKEIFLFNDDKLYKNYYEGACALYLKFLLKDFRNNKKKIFTFFGEINAMSITSILFVIMRIIYFSFKDFLNIKNRNTW